MLLGALEAGGTKMVCAIGEETGKILKTTTIPTVTPEETMPQLLSFFKEEGIEALGIGCFGPIDLNKKSKTYGHITSTPKLAWQNYDICGVFQKELNVPIGFDTDVNVACLGEMQYGSGKGLDTVVYITVGTGVGMGICIGGQLLHGMLHPEAGHMLVRRVPEDTFQGVCPFHKDCLEGLIAGGSIAARYGVKADQIRRDDIAWEYTAYYIAQAIVNLILTVSPERIILGGGVMKQEQFLPLVHKYVPELLRGYIQTKELEDITTYIVSPGCEDRQGVLGALKLAYERLELSLK